MIVSFKYFCAQKWSTSFAQNFDCQTLLKSRQTLLKLIHRRYSKLVSETLLKLIQVTQINLKSDTKLMAKFN